MCFFQTIISGSVNATNKRIEAIDITKGIGIILVTAGHAVYFGGILHNILFSFHVPLFFLISGLFYREMSLSKWIKKRIVQLIIPFAVYCILGLIITILIPSWRNRLSWQIAKADIYCGYPNCINVSSIWFALALFNAELLLGVLVIIKKKSKLACYTMFVLLVLSGIMLSRGNDCIGLPYDRLPLEWDCAFVGIVFLWIGWTLRKYVFDGINKFILLGVGSKAMIVLALNIVLLAIVMINGRVNLHEMRYGNFFLYLLGALIGSCIVVCISIMITRLHFLKNIFIWIGENSFHIMAIQAIAIRLFVLILNAINNASYQLYFLPPKFACVGSAFSMALSLFVVFVISYVRYIYISKSSMKG